MSAPQRSNTNQQASIQVVKSADIEPLTPEMETFRKTYAADLTSDEFNLAVEAAKRQGLDWFADEFHAPKFLGKMAPGASVHGLRKLASLTGLLDGVDGPYWCGADGKWVDVWLDEKAFPKAAKFTVYRKDMSRPFTAVVTWRERARYTRDGGLMPTWKSMPAHMLGIRAQTDAYKMAKLTPTSVVENIDPMDRGKAYARLHAVAADKGMSHEQARAVVKQLAPGIESLKDEDLDPETIHDAASLIDTLGMAALEPDDIEDGEFDGFDEEEEWRVQVRDVAESNDRSAWLELIAAAGTDSVRWAAMIEMAPTPSRANQLINKAKVLKLDPQMIFDAERNQKDAFEIRQAAGKKEASDQLGLMGDESTANPDRFMS